MKPACCLGREQKCSINPMSAEWKWEFMHIVLCSVCVYFTCSPCCLSSAVELRQAIVAMMNRKDELEEQNTYVGIYSPYLLPTNPQILTHTQTHTLIFTLTHSRRRYRMTFPYKLCQLVFCLSSDKKLFLCWLEAGNSFVVFVLAIIHQRLWFKLMEALLKWQNIGIKLTAM